MSIGSSRDHLEGLCEAIEAIESFPAGYTLPLYQADRKTQSAVERQLLILSEAAVRLGDEAASLCPGHDWRDIRGIGNHLRHGYHLIDPELIWRITQSELKTRKVDVLKALAQIR